MAIGSGNRVGATQQNPLAEAAGPKREVAGVDRVLPRTMQRFAAWVMAALLLLFAGATLFEVHRNHKWQPKVDFRAYRATRRRG